MVAQTTVGLLNNAHVLTAQLYEEILFTNRVPGPVCSWQCCPPSPERMWRFQGAVWVEEPRSGPQDGGFIPPGVLTFLSNCLSTSVALLSPGGIRLETKMVVLPRF